MAGYYDIKIDQGATYRQEFIWKDSAGDPIDLTSYTARMQIRRKVSSTAAEHEATTENSGIAITAGTGSVVVTISATDTAAFEFTKGVYDLELISGSGVVTRLLEGTVEVSPEVTR